MTIRKLEKPKWHPFFDRMTQFLLGGKQAEIEVAALNLGDQTEARWLPLIGIVYDPKDDVLEIALDGLDHMIAQPREIYIDDADGELSRLEVVDAAGVTQLVRLRDPLLLPAPA